MTAQRNCTSENFTTAPSTLRHTRQRYRADRGRQGLTGDTKLGIYAVGEHFLVYVPIDKARIAIVALIRQVRDVPAILQANHFQIQIALDEALKEFAAKR